MTRPLVRVSRALHLTTPRHDLQVAIGREHEDQIDSRVHLTLPPPAGPLPPVPAKHRTPRPHRPTKPVFTAAHPLRLWVAGDSLAQVPGDALERLGGAIDVVGVESRLSTGLARPDLYNWYTRFNQLIAGAEAAGRGALVRRRRRARLHGRRAGREVGRHASARRAGSPSTAVGSTASRAS